MTSPARYRFHATLHARPAAAETAEGAPLPFGDRPLPTLAVRPDRLDEPLPVTFEEAVENLRQLDRMFCEPDGSFVWVGQDEAGSWQIDGQLYDRHDRLLYVELKGCCPAAALDGLLRAFGWPSSSLVFQLVREAVLLEEAEFRRFCAAR